MPDQAESIKTGDDERSFADLPGSEAGPILDSLRASVESIGGERSRWILWAQAGAVLLLAIGVMEHWSKPQAQIPYLTAAGVASLAAVASRAAEQARDDAKQALLGRLDEIEGLVIPGGGEGAGLPDAAPVKTKAAAGSAD